MKAKSQFLLLVMLATIVFCEDTSKNSITLQQAICDSKCSGDVQCLKDCIKMPPKIKYRDEEAMANAILRCRDVAFIFLIHNSGTFVVERRASQVGNWSDALMSTKSGLLLDNLAPQRRYQFRFHRVFEDEVSQPEITGWFKTMSITHKPLKVAEISLVRLGLEPNRQPLVVRSLIGFEPAEDRSCFYDAILRDPTGNRVVDSRLATRGYKWTFTNLDFGITYTVSIIAYNANGVTGDENVLNFTTPMCPDMRRDTTMQCPPDKVEGLNVTATPKGENIFDVNVTWAMPKLIPDLYDISIRYASTAGKQHTINHIVQGTFTEFVFKNVTIVESYRVHIKAQSQHGRSSLIFKDFGIHAFIITEVAESGNFITNYLISTIPVVIGIGIAVYAYFRLRIRRLRQVDEYEMSPKRLMTGRVLGAGAFGIVRLGHLQNDQGILTNVAVKMLRDDSNENDLRSFLHEIKMMKALDEHSNIVSLLGCCTIGPYPFLVIEYCSRGDLRSFLRKSIVEARSLVDEAKEYTLISQKLPQRKKILKKNCDMASVSRIDDDYVQVSCVTEDEDTTCDPVRVTVGDMLNFGRQIATGMEFLSSNRIVHRDLATRNVLVCYDRTVKISDFGMSRDIYRENVYKKSGNGRMPLKWMAIEALTHQLYSAYSDVWSFGILLWEIVTLGGDPYPGVPTIDLLKRLQAGYRMERPENCSIPLHDVMLSCWRTRPQDRPTFTILRQELDKLICLTTENEYLDLNEVSEGRLILSQSRDLVESRVKYIQGGEAPDDRVSLPQGPNCGGVGDHI